MDFIKPKSLNGKQLKDELKAEGIEVVTIEDNANGDISFDVEKNKESLAASIVAAHVGIENQPTINDKLASVGLSVSDLKNALGL